MDELLKAARGQDRWRWTDDGYVEKGPFPPPRTSVSIQERNYDEATGRATIEITARDAGPHGRVHHSPTAPVTATCPVLTDPILETDATVLHFLAVDPDGKHETGESLRWANKLTITHDRKEQLGKRVVELRVVPRGTLRWNRTGANAKEGTPYTGPIELDGHEEVSLYVYAEDQEVAATRTFPIPKPSQKGAVIEKTKPALLRKKLIRDGNGPAFATLKAARAANAAFGGVQIEVGKGTKNAVTRFGSEAAVPAELLDAFVLAARAALRDDAADVKLTFGLLAFPTGHDLEVFLSEQALDVAPNEVEQ
jgi:hypothetical protein